MKQPTISPINISIDARFERSEIDYCIDIVEDRIASKQTAKSFRHKEELEECILHDFNHTKLEKTLSSLIPYKYQPYSLYRIISNKANNYMLTIFYNDITENNQTSVTLPDIKENITEMKENKKGFVFEATINNNKTNLVLKSINSAKSTVITNVIETFQKHNIFPEYMEIWYIKKHDKKVKSLYIVNCTLNTVLNKMDIQSLHDDFERYLHRYIKPMSVFDIVGPSMVGPSSSHTAGANKIGNIARNMIIAKSKFDAQIPTSIEVRLLSSFRDTGPGHYTPSAIGGGLWGLEPDHPQMLQHGDPAFLVANGIDLEGMVVPFSGYKKGAIEEESKYKNENNNNIAEIVVYTESGKYIITGFSIGGGNVEVRYLNTRLTTPLTGKEELYYHNGNILKASEAKKFENAVLIPAIVTISAQAKSNYSTPFNSFEELDDYLKREKKKLIDVVFEVESNLQGTTTEETLTRVAEYWRIMKASVKKGIKSRELSLLKLTGKDAYKINAYVKKNPLFDNIYGKAAAYAVAVNEVNAKCGVIVACPTAGSCGILPGVIQAYSEIAKPDRTKLLESILISGFLGMILFNDVTTAGADYGCQAEVGTGAAMAAAALTYLEDGSSQEIIQAFILAIKNSLGLICDPVAGLVEVPCVKRNGIFSSVAISASLMALSGVRSFVSPDEVILTMKEVGDKLHHDYKETAGGGLAKTRDGKAVDRAFESEVRRFFGEK
ncbi:MAG: L-serine ammonia-lyase, iron-sulfur-dependent, subunit alpha [Salinivirgaceae bacterium]|nr:L-serine ammonia-lyase, iron-sulfur-dependent, subunit alpha [Salinivirgaceae bacterium]MDD4746705.1 L-serine ammonia-lyase, iron-sulfur-dependent, subunit alpha [Salinivirgaceae bacterium]MDY0282715.1 L-serine ammonia-lyase, iron-sulfur-dependent, subunit alpha [Salinivirgaceae bacterium]